MDPARVSRHFSSGSSAPRRMDPGRSTCRKLGSHLVAQKFDERQIEMTGRAMDILKHGLNTPGKHTFVTESVILLKTCFYALSLGSRYGKRRPRWRGLMSRTFTVVTIADLHVLGILQLFCYRLFTDKRRTSSPIIMSRTTISPLCLSFAEESRACSFEEGRGFIRTPSPCLTNHNHHYKWQRCEDVFMAPRKVDLISTFSSLLPTRRSSCFETTLLPPVRSMIICLPPIYCLIYRVLRRRGCSWTTPTVPFVRDAVQYRDAMPRALPDTPALRSDILPTPQYPPAGSLPDLRMRESCRTMPLVGGDLLLPPPFSSRRCSVPVSITFVGSLDLVAVKPLHSLARISNDSITASVVQAFFCRTTLRTGAILAEALSTADIACRTRFFTQMLLIIADMILGHVRIQAYYCALASSQTSHTLGTKLDEFGHAVVLASSYELCPVSPSWFETRSEIGSKIDTKTVAPFEFRAGLEIGMKFILNDRFEISIRDQQPSSTNLDELEIQNHEISVVQHFYIGTKIKLNPGSELGSFDLGSGWMLVQLGISQSPNHNHRVIAHVGLLALGLKSNKGDSGTSITCLIASTCKIQLACVHAVGNSLLERLELNEEPAATGQQFDCQTELCDMSIYRSLLWNKIEIVATAIVVTNGMDPGRGNTLRVTDFPAGSRGYPSSLK
ncbi:hypothetical protein PR048_032246 [Dryococelus australis]|uniref:Uncharacterized protein n=1 Tax=Dryococelus australis TaxID=614101 RepID=A0ABQ9G2I1_9NEOP|nr:hypothetical protein PR048_032246 [Dryococelus australis]